jgi:hypothetical protein
MSAFRRISSCLSAHHESIAKAISMLAMITAPSGKIRDHGIFSVLLTLVS